MYQLKIVEPVTIVGQEYKAGDTVPVSKTLIHREVKKISSGIQDLLDAGVIETAGTDTYKVIGDVAVNTRGLIFVKNQTFTARQVFDYEDVVELPGWVAKGVTAGLFTLDDGVKHVTSVSIKDTGGTFRLEVGEGYSFTAEINPEDAADKTGIWSVSDTSVATIVQDGLNVSLTAVKPGTVTLTFTSTDGAKTVSTVGTVTAATVPVSSVAVAPTSPTAAVGATVQLTANVSPAGATNKTGVWSTADATIATVDANGLVTGVKAGTVAITFTTTDGSKKGNRNVTITEAA